MNQLYDYYTASVGTLAPPTAFQISPMLLDSITSLGREISEMPAVTPQELKEETGSFDADILILGGGPGGYVAALRAGRLGQRVVIVEKGHVGGTCLNVGCIPTKVLLSTVEVMEHVKRASEFGITVQGYSVDFAKMMDRKDKIVQQLRKGVEFLIKKDKVRLVRGTGKLIDNHTVEVATTDGKTEKITSRNIIIATGSVPALVPLPGLEIGESVWTSDELLSTKSVPKSLLVVGGGYVGLEFGYTFASLGSDVTVVEMLPQIAGTMDGEVATELEKILKRAGLKIMTNTTVTGAEDIKDGKRVKIKGADGKEESIEVEKVLIAVGRKPFSDGVGLETIGVENERGRIIVNDRMRTNIPNIYAIGDCVGNPMLAHAASHEGLVAVANCMGHDEKMDYRAVPGVVFTHPEVASVGLTEEEARKAHGENIRVGKFPFSANGKAMGMGERDGFVKVIAEPKFGEILGVHIIGPHATDMIAEAVVAIQSEVTIDDIAASIHPHPTLNEPLHEAVLDTMGLALHKP